MGQVTERKKGRIYINKNAFNPKLVVILLFTGVVALLVNLGRKIV